MDYGHALEFGVFITPAHESADAVVELARLADRAGLDLVTFQDHPYQPRFLDTWTLLSYVAARTAACGSPPTCSTCRCARRRWSRAPWPASTC